MQVNKILFSILTLLNIINSQQIFAGYKQTCFYYQPSFWSCWGSNYFGESDAQPNFVKHLYVFSASVGRMYWCAIMSDALREKEGLLYCFGDDEYGKATVSENDILVKAVECGDYHTCVISKDGVSCWGLNDQGQLDFDKIQLNNIYALSNRKKTTVVISNNGLRIYGQFGDASQDYGSYLNHYKGKLNFEINNRIKVKINWLIGHGYNHLCVYDINLKCIGSNELNQTNIGSNSISNISEIYSYGDHSCAVHYDSHSDQLKSNITCWGDNSHKQLETNQYRHTNRIAVGESHTCLMVGSGYIECNGIDDQMNLNPRYNNFHSFVSAGSNYTCVVTGGIMSCSGKNNKYKILNVDDELKLGTVDIGAGYTHLCASIINEVIHKTLISCWGSKDAQVTSPPARIYDEYVTTTMLEAGYKFTCAIVSTTLLDTSNDILCWGDNGWGQLDGTPGATCDMLKLGTQHACALTRGREIKCWGSNSQGQTALPFFMHVNIGVVAVGFYHSCAGTLNHQGDCWGYNNSGQADMPSEVRASVLGLWAGGNHSCVVDTALFVKCWGMNKYGQVTQPNIMGIRTMALGERHTCAVMYDGKIKCWGDNQYGQIAISK